MINFKSKKIWKCVLLMAMASAALNYEVSAQAPTVAAPAAKLSVAADQRDALYRQGEEVTFVIRAEGGVLPAEPVRWKLTKDNYSTISEGVAIFQNGEAKVSGKLDEPGFILCHVTYGKETKLAGAGVDPLLIKPSMPVPADFDAFWASQKARLAQFPVNARLTAVPERSTEQAEVFDLKADAVGETPVSGYYMRPRNAKPKSLPAILTLHGAGVRSAGANTGVGSWVSQDMLALDINAHGLPNGESAQYYKDLYASAKFKGYPYFGRESRDDSYFLGMFLRVIRAIDFLTSQPEWDGKTLVVYGTSQGGFQALAAAGLDSRVSFFVAGVPAGNDHTGMMVNRISGWPKLVTIGADGKPNEKILQASRYFDGVNFASRIKVPGFMTVGFIDTVCPPTSVYAMYNNLKGEKKIFNDIAARHENTPEASQRMRRAVRDHVAKQVRN